jgi:hypothetical protein
MAVALAIQPLLTRSIRVLIPLFVLYGVFEELGLGIETTKYPVHRLLDNVSDPSSLSERLVRIRILAMVRQARERVSARRYRAVRDSILRRLANSKRHHSVYISGKTYLLPLAYLQLKRVANLNESVDRVKVRLAQHCEVTIARGLQRAILRAIK